MDKKDLCIMPEPDQHGDLLVSENIYGNLPAEYGYSTVKFKSDLISMFEKKSAKGRLHTIINEWTRTALENYKKNERISLLGSRQKAMEYFKFFRKFPQTKLFKSLLAQTMDKSKPDPIRAAQAFLDILAQERNVKRMLNKGDHGIDIPFDFPIESEKKSDESGDSHGQLVKRKWIVSELIRSLKLQYEFASQRSSQLEEVFYPDEEVEHSQLRSFSEIHRIASAEFMFQDEIFFSRVAQKKTRIIRYQKRIYTPRKFAMLIDVSGSMKDNDAGAYTRADYAIASAICLLSEALRGANMVTIILFDGSPHPPLTGTPQDIVKMLFECPFSGGGTSIDSALKVADKDEFEQIILVTDGDDKGDYRPHRPLITYACGKTNKRLKDMSQSFQRVD